MGTITKKVIITENQLNILKRNVYLLKESFDIDDFYEMIVSSVDNVLERFKRDPNKPQTWELIDPMQYRKALDEFIKYGELMRFPVKIIDKWVAIIIRNYCQLWANTYIAGHMEGLPYEEIRDAFPELEEASNGEIHDWIVESGLLDSLVAPDGSDAWSDYALNPLGKLIEKLISEKDWNKKLVLINGILDVVHARGDISSMFLKGGNNALSRITNETKIFDKIALNEGNDAYTIIYKEAVAAPEINPSWL